MLAHDIGTPVPMTLEPVFANFDCFLTSIRFARLYSRVVMELLSINATTNSLDAYLAKIGNLEKVLERYWLALPEGFRQLDESLSSFYPMESHEVIAAIRLHLHCCELQIALCRLRLHVIGSNSNEQSLATRKTLMKSARAVIHLTRIIHTEAGTPL